MAIIVDSKFQPFSFQEMLQPVMIAQTEHRDLENQYAELEAKANVWDEMANEQTDPLAYAMYKRYSNDLSMQADALASKGIDINSRKAMLGLKSRYSKEITPIEQAYARRRELADEQRKRMQADPTMLYERDASLMSLDDFINNPQADYGKSYSGALITQQVASAAEQLSKEARDSEEGRRKLRRILPYQYEMVQQNGFSREAVAAAIAGSPDASTILTGLVDSAISTSGVNKWGDASTRARALDYARQGLYKAIGETKYNMVTDQAGLTTLQYNLQDRNARRAEARAAARKVAEKKEKQLNKLAVNPLNIYSSTEKTVASNNLKNYSKYFYKNAKGQWMLNEAGRKEYFKTHYNPPMRGYAGSPDYYKPQKSSFRKFMESLGGDKYIGIVNGKETGLLQPGNMGNLWAQYVADNNEARYDATRVTEFDYPIAGEQQVDMKNAIMTASRGVKLEEVDYDDKSKTFKPTGNSLSMADLKGDKHKVTNTRFSPYGNTVMIQDGEGNVKRYRMPAGINTTNENNRDALMSWASFLQENKKGGNISLPDYIADERGLPRGTVITATPEQVQAEYDRTIQEAYLYHSQLGLQNKTKDQEFSPYGY